jgi:hypothetical protein
MVDCCANPGCRADFKLLKSGDLYALERRSANTEFFWLCSECAPQYDLLLNVDGRLSFRPRGDQLWARPADPEGSLRLVSRAAHRFPWRSAIPTDERRAIYSSSERGRLDN